MVATCWRRGNEYANAVFLSVCTTSACDSIYQIGRAVDWKGRKTYGYVQQPANSPHCQICCPTQLFLPSLHSHLQWPLLALLLHSRASISCLSLRALVQVEMSLLIWKGRTVIGYHFWNRGQRCNQEEHLARLCRIWSQTWPSTLQGCSSKQGYRFPHSQIGGQQSIWHEVEGLFFIL